MMSDFNLSSQAARRETRAAGAPQRKNTVMNISFQDPRHLAGGQGVAVLNFCLAQLRLGWEVVWISPCIGAERPGDFREGSSRNGA